MPFYIYACETCKFEEEVFHSMKECDNKDSIYLKCKLDAVDGMVNKCTLKRKVTLPSFNRISSLSPNEKKKELQKRSKKHFKANLQDKFHQMNKPDYIP